MSRRLVFALIASLAATVAHADGKDEIFTFTIRKAEQVILIMGKSKLPNGTRLSAALTMSGSPVQWRKAYVMGGKFRFNLPRKVIRPGTYVVLVRFEKRNQIPELSDKLKQIHQHRWDSKAPLQVGDKVDAATQLLAEAVLLAERLAALKTHLAALDTMAKDNMEKVKSGGYKFSSARKAYVQWIAQLKKLGQPLTEYAKKHTVHYFPEPVAEAINLIDKSERRARGEHRGELEAKKLTVPREWQPQNPMITKASMIDEHIQRSLPKVMEKMDREKTKAEEQLKAAKEEADKGGDK